MPQYPSRQQAQAGNAFLNLARRFLGRLAFLNQVAPEDIVGGIVNVNVVGGSLAKGRPPSMLSADRTVIGEVVTTTFTPQVVGQWDLAIANNDFTVTTTNGGTVTQANGQLTLATSANASGTAKIQSNKNIQYGPGKQVNGQGTASFTTPTDANSDQRFGLYGTNNGFFWGLHGLNFGITVRSGGVDTFTTRASLNGDPLDGSSSSLFTRNNVPEAIDFTKLNVWRVRFVWHGSAPVLFEVMSPDGYWVVYHTIRQPNLATVPHIQSPNLPMTYEVIKAASDATNLQIKSGSCAAGTGEEPAAFLPEQIKGRKYQDFSLTDQTADATAFTVSTGRTLHVTSLVVSFFNTSNTNNGIIQVTDGNAGTVKLPLETSNTAGGTGSTAIAMPITFTTPLKFTTSVFVHIVSGTVRYSISGNGFEAEI